MGHVCDLAGHARGLAELLEALWKQVREAIEEAWEEEPQPETYRP